MFWKRKRSFLLIWLVVTATGVGIVLRLPTIYHADTVIMVESQRIPEKFVTSTINTDLRDRLSALSQQILNYRHLLDIVEKYDLYHDLRKNHVQEEIVEMMRSNIGTQVEENWMTKVRVDTRPSAFRVSFQGENPSVVAMVANQLGNLFIDENLKQREVQAQGTSDFLQTQVAEANRRLEEQEAKLSEFKLKYNGELPEQENALISTISQLQGRLQGINDAIDRAQQNKQLLDLSVASAQASMNALSEMTTQARSAPTSSVTGLPIEPPKASDTLEKQLMEMRVHHTDNFPGVRALIAQLARVRQEEADAAKNTSLPQPAPGAETGSASRKPDGSPEPAGPSPFLRSPQLVEASIRERERQASIQAQSEVASSQIQSLNAERKDVLARIADSEQRVAKLPVREQQLAGLKRDYEITKLNYQSLADKKLSAEMSTEMERRQKSERFTVIEPARVPEKPLKPNRPMYSALSALVGMLLALMFSIGPEFKKNTLLGDWEFPKGLPVLGRVPEIKPAQGDTVQPTNVPVRLPRVSVGRRSWISLLVLLLVVGGLVTAIGFYLGRIRI